MDTNILKQQEVSFYAALFGRHDTVPLFDSFARWQLMKTQADHVILVQPFGMEEIKAALLPMKELKAPEHNGIQPLFF